MNIEEIINYLEYLVQHVEYDIKDAETIESKEDIIRLIRKEILDVYYSECN